MHAQKAVSGGHSRYGEGHMGHEGSGAQVTDRKVGRCGYMPLTKLPQCVRVGGLGHRDRQLHAVTVLEDADPGLMGVDAALLQKQRQCA